MQLSVVVPLLNEAEQIRQRLSYFRSLTDSGIELLFVDGGSLDNSRAILQQNGFRVLESAPGRARQMNHGAKFCRGEVLLFLHIDSYLQNNLADYLDDLSVHPWGYFKLALSNKAWLYRFIASSINFRSRLFRVATGDQGIFIKSSLFHAVGGFKDIELMEDIELSRRLSKHSSPHVLSGPIVTSSRRWETRGPFKTALLMWSLQLAFKLGVSPRRLHSWYQ